MSAKIIKNIHCYSVIRMNLFSRIILSITQNDTTTDGTSAFSSSQPSIYLTFCPKTSIGKLFAVFKCLKQVLVDKV